MQIVKYNPLRELQKMEKDIDKFWQSGWSFPTLVTDTAAIDMYEEDGKLVAELNLPNFKKEEVTVTADDGVLEVSAVHNEKEEKDTKRRYILRESSSQFFRRVALPEGADGSKAEASYKDGQLKVSMPLTPKKVTKNIAIK